MNSNSNTKAKGAPIKLDGINHFAMNVRNMDRAEAFYTGILGFPVIMRTETQGGLKHVEVDAGNVAIALFESPDLDFETGQKIMTDDGYLHYPAGAQAARRALCPSYGVKLLPTNEISKILMTPSPLGGGPRSTASQGGASGAD